VPLDVDGWVQQLERLCRRHPASLLCFELVRVLIRRDVAGAASAMAFDLFLAAIPMLALAGWLSGKLMADQESVLRSTALLLNLTPNEVQALIWQQLDRFSVGKIAPFALLGALWAASGAFTTSMSLLESSAGPSGRPWWKRRVLALCWVLVSILAFGAAAVLAVWLSGGPARVLAALSGGQGELDPRVSRWLLLSLLAALAVGLLSLFYLYAAPRPNVKRRVLPGATLAVVFGGLVSLIFAYYAGHLARFALFYGALSAVAITLAWLWLICFVVLAAAELNQLLENGVHQVGPTQTPKS
jgi:uncharacterized BrkB/YihY/UPF0761 family membrane protein